MYSKHVCFHGQLFGGALATHRRAATLANSAACAQLEETLLGSGLSSSAYGNKNTILGIAPGCPRMPADGDYVVS